MIEQNDWRLRGQEDYLKGRKLLKIPFQRSEMSDHYHCDFCWAKFSDSDGDLHEGYVTAGERNNWICPECFADFREMFQWELVEPDAPDMMKKGK